MNSRRSRSRAPVARRRSRPSRRACRRSTITAPQHAHQVMPRRARTIATVTIALSASSSSRLEVPHEQRHEGRGEHAAEQQLVDDVGGLVGVAVRARERAGAERVRDRGDADEPGDPREGGADRDDRARAQQAGRPGRRRRASVSVRCSAGTPGVRGGDDSVGCSGLAARRRRRRRKSWAHHRARKSTAPTVRNTPTLLTKRRAT